jgi:cyclopropane fatty-acyl-phospholipid synthase-like methyltransferase
MSKPNASVSKRKTGGAGAAAALVVLLLVVVALVGVAVAANSIVDEHVDYNNVTAMRTFANGRRGYLNMGLWSEGATDFGAAQAAMYLEFFKLAELHREDLQVLETGCGTGEHYLLWQRHGLRSRITAYEPHTTTHPDVLAKTRVRVLKKSALELRCAACFDRIVAIESAFHYPNRRQFFERCHTALKPGGVLLLADIVINKEGARRARWLQRCVARYYEKRVFKMPPENAIGVGEYEQQLRDCRFSSVRVVDVTRSTLKPFYEGFRRNVSIDRVPQLIQRLHNSCMDSVAMWEAFSYVLAVCVKAS